MTNQNNQSQITSACPYDDCDHQIAVPEDTEESDIIVCRTETNGNVAGCNRNAEAVSVTRGANDNVTAVEFETLEVDEDWGE